MIADLKTYPTKEKSGVYWLGDVPAHWGIRRLKILCNMHSGDAITEEQVDSVGVFPVYGGNGVRGYASKYNHDGTFVLIGRQGALCGNVHVARGRFWASEHAVVVTPRSDYLPRWLGAMLEVINLNQYSISAAQPGLSVERILDIPIPVPPVYEQTVIARYLDHAVRSIGRYIRAKQKLIALLEEQKQALICEAVTGRMDLRTNQPYCAYKPPGVDWLKDVPQHWERRRLKTLLRSVDRRSGTGGETLLSLRRDYGVVVYAEHFSRPPQARSLVGFKMVATGQMVVNRMQANNGLVFCSNLDGLVSPDYSVFETKTPLQMEFLSDLLRTPEYRAHFRRSATGLGTGTAGFLRLYDDRFLDTVVFLPPEDEQTMMLRELSNRLATFNTLIDTERRALQRIDEYHSCLVAEVITGKVDVREAVVPTAEGDPLKVEDNQEIARRRDAELGLHGSGLIAQETQT